MITVYSRNQCSHCDSAKRWLESRNINYREVNIDVDPTAYAFMQAQGHRSVPQFYVGSRLLIAGGWAELQKLTADEVIDRVAQTRNTTNLGTL